MSRRSVEQHVATARKEALADVERMARAVLRACPSRAEFVMGMGRWFFTLHNGEVEHDAPAKARALAAYIATFDTALCLTGSPMRFTAAGPVETDW